MQKERNTTEEIEFPTRCYLFLVVLETSPKDE